MSIATKIFSLIFKEKLVRLDECRRRPDLFQREWFERLIAAGAGSHFAIEHGLSLKTTLREFRQLVPLRNYDALEPFIERVRRGEDNVLTTAPVNWFARSSGTSSSKSKFIPITADSLKYCHISGMKNMLATYISQNPHSKIFDGDALTLGGSVTLDDMGQGRARCGDLSAVLLKNSPRWIEMVRVPKRRIALMPDFEKKVEAICREAHRYDVTNFSGVPSWNMVLIRAILQHTGKANLLEIWPNLELFMHGGINFEPYKEEYCSLIPSPLMHYMENYNASEGYFAFQDDSADMAQLLMVDNGIFYEFIPVDKLEDAIEGKFVEFDTVETVKKGVNYAMVITTNGGLWRYLIGDSVQFTSLQPHKIVITGRTQLYINTFGEELMVNNTERALAAASEKHGANVENYTVAPIFMRNGSKGSHQWLIEFSTMPDDIGAFTRTLDGEISKLNSDYEAKRRNNSTMEMPTVTPLKKGTFYVWMKKQGKLGGQNKVPRLYQNRVYVEQLLEIDNEGADI